MQRHILNKRKPSCTHISPRVTLQVLKKDLSKEKPWESYEKTPQKQPLRKIIQQTLDGRRLPTNFDRRPTTTPCTRLKTSWSTPSLLRPTPPVLFDQSLTEPRNGGLALGCTGTGSPKVNHVGPNTSYRQGYKMVSAMPADSSETLQLCQRNDGPEPATISRDLYIL